MNLTTATFHRKSREWFTRDRGFVSQKRTTPAKWVPSSEPRELRLKEDLLRLRDLVLGFFVREDTREWAPSTFYWALFQAFTNLYELAQSQGDSFWRLPEIRTDFHFGWDARLVVNGREPHEILSAPRLAVETMSEEDRELKLNAMLAVAFHGLAPPGYHRDVGGSYAVHIPPSVEAELERLPPEEREAEGWRRVAPFTMGSREFRPYESYREPETIQDPLPPPVSIRADVAVNGKPLYEVAAFTEVGQVAVEPGETGAHFPLIVGFTLSPDSAPPSTWPESERATFWPSFFKALEAALRGNVANVRLLRDAPTRLDRGAAHLVHGLVDLKLPRKLASVPTLESLIMEEVKRLLEDEADVAFRDTREEGLNGRPPLLRYVTTAKDGRFPALTEEGRSALLERRGHLWFRRAQKDEDGVTREYVVRHLPVPGGGFLEAAFTLYGKAWPLVEDAREDFEKKAKAVLAPSPQTTIPFYDAAEEKLKEELESRLQFIGAVKDAHVLMQAIMSEFGATGQSPVVMKLQDLRHLLKCERSPDGPRRVRGALKALSELRFELKASRMGSLSGKTYGAFVSEVKEAKRGPGEHVDGDVAIYLAPSAFGGLRAFALSSSKAKDPKSLLLGWTKNLSKDEEETLSSEPFLKGFSKLAPYYDRHMGFTSSQTKLRQWIEHEITLNKDGVRKERVALRRKPSAIDANEPREYDRAFCPLLPEGQPFYASLGHFEARKGGGAERGRKLVGTSAPASSSGKSGGRAGGLLQVMGYELPKSRVAKTKTTTEALQDIRFVVEEHFGGVVVAHLSKNEWLRLEEATEKLSVEELLDVAWFFFLPPNWLPKMRDRYNALQEKRHASGETDAIYKMVASDAPEAPLERPLRERLRKAMADRGLSGAKVAEVFGVSRMAVSKWLATEPGKGSPIAEALVPLVERWIATGKAPSADELAAIRKPGGGKGGRPSQNADA